MSEMMSIAECIIQNSNNPCNYNNISERIIKEIDNQIRTCDSLDFKVKFCIDYKRVNHVVGKRIRELLLDHGYIIEKVEEENFPTKIYLSIIYNNKDKFQSVINPCIITAEEAYNLTLEKIKLDQDKKLIEFKEIVTSEPIKVIIRGDEKFCCYKKPRIENLEDLVKTIIIPTMTYEITDKYLVFILKK